MPRSKRTERLQLLLDQEELQTLDEWRFEMRMPTRAAAIRQLIRLGLKLEVSKEDLNVNPASVPSGDLGIVESPVEPELDDKD